MILHLLIALLASCGAVWAFRTYLKCRTLGSPGLRFQAMVTFWLMVWLASWQIGQVLRALTAPPPL